MCTTTRHNKCRPLGYSAGTPSPRPATAAILIGSDPYWTPRRRRVRIAHTQPRRRARYEQQYAIQRDYFTDNTIILGFG